MKTNSSAVTNRVTSIENKHNVLENDLVTAKSELLVLKNIVGGQSEIIKKCNGDVNSIVSQSFVNENRNKMCNLLCWGLNEVPIKDTDSLILNVLVHGLSGAWCRNLQSFSDINNDEDHVAYP